jgi:hypothetical protein
MFKMLFDSTLGRDDHPKTRQLLSDVHTFQMAQPCPFQLTNDPSANQIVDLLPA